MRGTRGKGLLYERRARTYLEQRGLVCLQQNYRSRFGEIDLVMRDRETVCFVEIRYRRSLACGGACYSITPAKRRRIVKTALFYLAAHERLANSPLRFDALLIQRQDDCSERIDWIRSAFDGE